MSGSKKFPLKCLGLYVALALIIIFVSLANAANNGGEQFEIFKVPGSPGVIRLEGVNGSIFSLSDYRGKVVIINFWRKNCPYCVREKEHLKKMVKIFKPSDLKIVSVDLWDDPIWVKNQATKTGEGIDFATGLNGRKSYVENVVRGRLMGYYVINEANEAIFEIKGFPSSFIIDKDGRIVAGHTGLVNWMAPSVHHTLVSLVGSQNNQGRGEISDEAELKWLEEMMSFPDKTNVSLMKLMNRVFEST
ncbi:MAG: TlpA family protein disulfide reductase [Desulfomonilaceae bacterium]